MRRSAQRLPLPPAGERARWCGKRDDERLDPYLVGEVWWDLVRPLCADIPCTHRRRRYMRLRDLDPLLHGRPLDLAAVQNAMHRVPVVEPVDKRVSAVILGVPR